MFETLFSGLAAKLFAGLGIIGAILGGLFMVRKSGRDAERLRRAEDRLEAREDMDEIRRDVSEMTMEEKRKEAEKWSKP